MFQQIGQVLVFAIIAIPFIYMAYDVTRDLTVQAVKVVNKNVKPGVFNLISTLIK